VLNNGQSYPIPSSGPGSVPVSDSSKKEKLQKGTNGDVPQKHSTRKPTEVMKAVISDNIEIAPGLGYIIKEEKAERSFKIFKKLLAQNVRGLCITRTHPRRIRSEYQIENIPILWLSADSPNKENVIVPTFLPKLNTLIINFIQKYDNVVILLEGIEYLIDQNDFNAVLSLIHSLNDHIMDSKARLLIPLDPLILDERELHMLTRDFKII
jgi:two-component system cell cycle response regulator